MARVSKVNWLGDAGFEFVQMRKEGKSYKDIATFFYSKYGVNYTAARLSQIDKQFRDEGRLPAKAEIPARVEGAQINVI